MASDHRQSPAGHLKRGRRADIDSPAPQGLPISFSAGMVELAHHETLEAAIERADQTMHQARTLGRARSIEG